MSTRIGIVGLPNAGKSSLFNALTRAEAQTANYPFTTIEPNVAIVPVADRRLDEVARVVGASEVVYDTVAFHDIAGLVAGAHRGEGLGNQFLSHIRETHAIVHVVRAHHDEGVIHPEGSVGPLRDIETIETELALADLEQAGRRLERVAKAVKSGSREAQAEESWLEAVVGGARTGAPGAHGRGSRGGELARRATSACSRQSRCSSSRTSTRAARRCRSRSPSTRARPVRRRSR